MSWLRDVPVLAFNLADFVCLAAKFLGAFELFDDSFKRDRVLSVVIGSYGEVRRMLQPRASGCVCPINTDPIAPVAPTETEFARVYDNAVTDLRSQGTLVNVQGVSDIA